MMYGESSLHILAICSRPLIDIEGHPITLLDVAEERRRIEVGIARAGDAAHVHFLPEATTGEVHSALRDVWNVVHFTGHGTNDGSLLLEDGLGVAHMLTKWEVARLFTGRQAPLVVLSACYSETVGQELHAAGVPAVVAVDARVPIADLAAIIFAAHFYAALARGWDVSRAFDDAQRAVSLDPKVGDSKPPQDWRGNNEEPWSQRFKLIGAVQSVTDTVGARTHHVTAAHPSVASNLPPRSVNFVGRAKEIVDVVKAFDEAKSQRVCIYGSGGLGKTELAKAAARWYHERARVGAVLWTSASQAEGEYRLRDLASLLGIAARVFRLPLTPQSMFDEQKTVVSEFLNTQRALVLLDNWETIEPQHRRELWNFALSLPDTVRVLITSRDVLPPRDARNLELDTLASKDATELFLKIARNTGYLNRNSHLMTEEMAILHSLCERLNGYPLAIEVVAGQTLSRTLSEVWADFQRVPQKVLEGKDELTGEPRGVWTSLGLSYDVLSPDEQALFRQMGILLAPASAGDIAAITETANPRAVLNALYKRSLVQMREGAYSLLPIVRDYAQGKLDDAGQDPCELHERAVNHYGQKGTIENTLTATDHLFELASRFELRHAAERFIKYLSVSSFYYDLLTRGYWAEARSKAEQTIAVARALGDKKTEAGAINDLGICYQRIGEYERATELQRRAQILSEESEDKRGVGVALYQLGLLAYLQGNYGEAAQLYRQSLKISEELGNKEAVAADLYQLGILAREQGDYSEATRLYRQSLEIEKELGNKKGVAGTLNELGMLAHEQADYGEATRLYRQSLEIKKEIGDKNGVANTLHQLGTLAGEQGDYGEAMRLYRQGLKIGEELGDRRQIARLLNQLGIVALSQGDYGEATRLGWQSLEIKKEIGDKSGVASTLRLLGTLAQMKGDYGEATRLFQQDLEICKELGHKKGLTTTLAQLGQCYRARGQMKEALNYLLKSLVICEELRSPNRNLILGEIGRVRAAAGEAQFAAWLRELTTEAERISELLEEEGKEFVKDLVVTAQMVVKARKQESAEQQAGLAQELAQAEAERRALNTVEEADFLAVLRGLLAGEEVTNKIAALAEPFKEIAEQARTASTQTRAVGRDGLLLGWARLVHAARRAWRANFRG